MSEPGILEKEATEVQTRLAPPWNVIVHNDPITEMIYVTMVFRRTFGYSFPKAHGLMMEVHTRGRAIVWTGAREKAEVYLQKLHGAHLLATMESVDD